MKNAGFYGKTDKNAAVVGRAKRARAMARGTRPTVLLMFESAQLQILSPLKGNGFGKQSRDRNRVESCPLADARGSDMSLPRSEKGRREGVPATCSLS